MGEGVQQTGAEVTPWQMSGKTSLPCCGWEADGSLALEDVPECGDSWHGERHSSGRVVLAGLPRVGICPGAVGDEAYTCLNKV